MHGQHQLNANSASQRPVLLLSTANFDSDVWTNKQFLASKLSTDRKVYYVNSLGLRAPGLNRSDILRLYRSITKRARRSRRKQGDASTDNSLANLTIISPLVIPLHGCSFVRLINRILLQRQIRRCVPELSESVLWTFSPIAYALEDITHATVYHSVDLLHTLDRVPASALIHAERDLLKKCSETIASSVGVYDHLIAQGASKPLLWENVADVAVFERVETGRQETAIFAGNLTPQKIDIGLLQAVVSSGVTLKIAGPVDIDGTSDPRIPKLLAEPNVTYLGRLSQNDLAYHMNRCTVGLIPYSLNDYTAGVFPLKVYEYLAAGLQVIATPLPSLQGHRDNIQLTETAVQFVEAVRANLVIPQPVTIEARKRLAREHSWESRMDAVRALLGGY